MSPRTCPTCGFHDPDGYEYVCPQCGSTMTPDTEEDDDGSGLPIS